ncbi:MAG: S9 family peptidase [Bacteroidetes bacterium]|nr:S9 family peptidase [Bacteroidota bacterium]
MKYIIALSLTVATSIGLAQDKLLTIQEAVLKGRTSLAPKRLQALTFIPGAGKFSYVDNNAIISGEVATGKTQTLTTLNAINKALKANNEDSMAAIPAFSWKSANVISFETQKGPATYTIGGGAEVRSGRGVSKSGELENEDKASVTEYLAYTQDNNLYVKKGDAIAQVTTDGSYELVYGKSVHREEFGISKGTFWSPKGNMLAFYRMDQSDVTDYPVIDWSVKPAKNKNIKYPMAGGKSHYVTVGVYNVGTDKTTYIKTEGPKEQYLTNIAWSPDEKYIFIAILNREQNHMYLNQYDAATGAFVKTLFEEQDEKYVEPLHPVLFLKNNPAQFIWQSRRDGYNHLYLYGMDGKLVKQLTKGTWEVKDVNGFDEKGDRVFFHANEQSPVNQDFYSVTIKSGELKRLTYGNGYHTAILDEKGNYFIDSYTSCYTPREYNIINTTSKKAVNIFKAENPIKDYKLGKWSLFTIKNADGTDLWCRLFKPTNFDSTKKYPVLVYLYNGPHSQLVTNSWMAGGEVWYQYMAEKGFIVFTLDGRGTSFRGKAFEQATHRHLGDKEMEDQLKGVDYLKSLPYVDANRIGVHGWSFGGFMTTSLMTRHPGVYKVGVAGGPVIDWSYYEIMYTERYMDSPLENKEGYDKNNLLNYTDKLKGKFLMIHGAQDDVVVWQHSMMYQKKAVDKGIQMDYYVYPGHFHNVIGKDRAHLMEKITNYFIENL